MKKFLLILALMPFLLSAQEYCVPKEVVSIIIEQVQKKYPNDYDMQEILIRSQINSYKKVQDIKKDFEIDGA